MKRLCVFALLAMGIVGCERSGPAPAGAGGAGEVRVASLVPAATDLIIGMGAGDKLVAVSNYDVEREGTRGLPRVGDYQNADWEQLRRLRPTVAILFQKPDRVAPGVRQKAQDLGIRLVNVRTETLADLFSELENLGQILGESRKAAAAAQHLRQRLEAVRTTAKGRPRMRTLLVRDEKAQGVVGRGNFLDDLLAIAGGENVVQTVGWPTVDREMLLSLKPDAVLVLLSGEPPQVLEQVQRTWRGMPQVPAVAAGRVRVINRWYSQQPGWHVAELAEEMAAALGP